MSDLDSHVNPGYGRIHTTDYLVLAYAILRTIGIPSLPNTASYPESPR